MRTTTIFITILSLFLIISCQPDKSETQETANTIDNQTGKGDDSCPTACEWQCNDIEIPEGCPPVDTYEVLCGCPPPDDKTCKEDSDCKDGNVCEPTTGCDLNNMECVPGCHKDSDCDEGQKCVQKHYCFTCPCPKTCVD